jgi:hypothetical protein
MMSRNLFRGLASMGFVLVVMIFAAVAMAVQRGQVGGPPTLALGPPDEARGQPQI